MFSLGSLGIKLLGGHYPLTSEATARAIEVANQKKAYVAFHAGSLAKDPILKDFRGSGVGQWQLLTHGPYQ